MSAVVNEAACMGCGLCSALCPFGAIRMEDRVPHISAEKCKSCGLCVSSCPRSAMDLSACSNSTLAKAIWRAALSTRRPRCLVFACDHCGREEVAKEVRAAGLRNVRFARIPCGARVDPAQVLEALASGLDLVVVLMCEPGTCGYEDAVLHADVKLGLLAACLEELGLRERFYVLRCTPQEASEIAKTIIELAGGSERH